MQTETINILDESFEMPVLTLDLQDLIEDSISQFERMPLTRKETREYKLKVNELIAEYNDRRGMKIYNKL
jgi:hypothetical protein